MYNDKKILFFHVHSHFHPGAGQAAGVVDNPVQRSKATDFPKAQANGVKGSLRQFFEERDPREKDKKILVIFGPDETQGSEEKRGEGAVSFGEGKLLFFPVRSCSGVFAYATCPLALMEFQRDLEACGQDPLINEEGKAWQPGVLWGECLAPPESPLRVHGSVIVLDEFRLSAEQLNPRIPELLAEWIFPSLASYRSYKEKFKNSIVVIHDDLFRFFVKYRTEVEAQNRIDDARGTVDPRTGVWQSEYIPPESILYSAIMAGPPWISLNPNPFENEKIMEYVVRMANDQFIAMGGEVTTGKGQLVMHFGGCSNEI